jgi:protein-arginine kinase activator protein McsA
MTTEPDAAGIIHDAAITLSEVASEVERGCAGREEVADAVANARGAVVRAFGPKPRAKAGEGGKWKMLEHLQENLGEPIHREELAAVSDIDEWARRVRELRVQDGFDIEYLGNDLYVLRSVDPDEEKAEEWRIANEIRKSKLSVTEKLEAYFEANVGRVLRRDQLDYVANKKMEATRRTRELRDEKGWPIISHIDDPGLRLGEYMLISANRADFADPNQREYPIEVRTAVFKRDGYRCQECGRTREDALAAGDTRFILEADHIVGVADPAQLTNEEKADIGNFRSLCHRCHATKTGMFQREQRQRRRSNSSVLRQ